MSGLHHAAVEDEARVLVRVPAALRGDAARLAWRWRRQRGHQRPLEHGGAVAEDEVDGAGDAAAGVEVAHGVRVQRVLVAQQLHAVQHRAVARGAERHRLVRVGARRVGDGQALRSGLSMPLSTRFTEPI